jgi:hypothetical protein
MDKDRVANDMIWMPEDNVPLVFSIMAVSAFIFGGLHCLAWNFQFPSEAELILWRTASIASAVVPVLSLIASLYLSYLATAYADKIMASWLVDKLADVAQFPAYMDLLRQPVFYAWPATWIALPMSQPAGSRNFNEVLTEQAVEQANEEMKRAGTWDTYTDAGYAVSEFTGELHIFFMELEKAKDGIRDPRLVDNLLRICVSLKEHFKLEAAQVFWDDYEESYLKTKFTTGDKRLPPFKCIRRIMATLEQLDTENIRVEKLRKDCEQISKFLTISSGILYIAARFIILVLLFTCLRAVPLRVYENTPWTRFLPNFS